MVSDREPRVSLWPEAEGVPVLSGYGELPFFGKVYEAVLKRRKNAQEGKPTHTLFLSTENGAHAIGLFDNGPDAKGPVISGGYQFDGNLQVKLWPVKSDNANAPKLSVAVEEKGAYKRNEDTAPAESEAPSGGTW